MQSASQRLMLVYTPANVAGAVGSIVVQKPPIPADEAERLGAVLRLELMDTTPEERFDRFSRLAHHLLHVPVALISLVAQERQWFKSSFGLDVQETQRDISFCGHAILDTKVFVVEDTETDTRFHDNPLVTGDPHIRAYAGAPIFSDEGKPVGTFCVLDHKPRAFTDEELTLLTDLAGMVEQELSLARLSTSDSLTGLSNMRGFELLVPKVMAMCQRQKQNVTLALIDLSECPALLSQGMSAQQKDAHIKLFSSRLKFFFRDSDIVARTESLEFSILLTGTQIPEAEIAVRKLTNAVKVLNQERKKEDQFSFLYGLANYDYESPKSIRELQKEAKEMMLWHDANH